MKKKPVRVKNAFVGIDGEESGDLSSFCEEDYLKSF